MKLFDIEVDHTKNLLPHGGTVYYFGKILNEEDAIHYLNVLLNKIEWKNDEAIIFGKKIITKRKEHGMAKNHFNIPTQKLPSRHYHGLQSC